MYLGPHVNTKHVNARRYNMKFFCVVLFYWVCFWSFSSDTKPFGETIKKVKRLFFVIFVKIYWTQDDICKLLQWKGENRSKRKRHSSSYSDFPGILKRHNLGTEIVSIWLEFWSCELMVWTTENLTCTPSSSVKTSKEFPFRVKKESF